MEVKKRVDLFIKKFKYTPEAFEVCPHFEVCSVNKCPLHKDFTKLTIEETDKQKKWLSNFCKRWDITTYQNANKPCLFAGVYNIEDVEIINKHKGFKVVWNPGRIRPFFTLLDSINLVVLRRMKSIDHSLIEGKYKIKTARFEIKDYSLFKPNPLGDCIYCYLNSEKFKYLYGFKEVEKLRKLTKYKILVGMLGSPIEQVRTDLYSKCFVYFKPSLTGGGSTSIELALMGRKTVSKGKGNFYLLYDSIEQACEIIENEAKNIGKTVGSVLNENYHDTGKEWKRIKFWL